MPRGEKAKQICPYFALYPLFSIAFNKNLAHHLKAMQTLRAYFSMAKPGILFGNFLTALSGFAFAGSYRLAIPTLSGLLLIIASACIFNNFVDRKADQKMERTKGRPLAAALIPSHNALLLASLSLTLGALLLLLTSQGAAILSLVGFAIYLFVYTPLKYKTHYATLIGSIAGAIPPVVGYYVGAGALNMTACLLFLLLVTWQMPHFYAISLFRFDEYQAAQIPLLPHVKGVVATKRQMALYIIAFLACAFCLTSFSPLFCLSTMALGLGWLLLALRKDEGGWAKKMFFYSLAMIFFVSLAVCLSN